MARRARRASKVDAASRRVPPRYAAGCRVYLGDLFFLRRRPGLLPTVDAGGEVLDVGVPEVEGGLGGEAVGCAVHVAAVGDNQRILVGREELGEVVLMRDEVDGAGNMAVLVGVAAIHVEDDRRLV